MRSSETSWTSSFRKGLEIMANARGFARSPRVDYEWDGGPIASTQVAATQLVFTVVVATDATTLRRVRGIIHLYKDSAPVAGDRQRVGLGLVIRPEGYTSAPSSLSGDMSAEWLWITQAVMFSRLSNNAAQTAGAYGSENISFVVDTKSMRKMKKNDELVLVVTPAQDSGTPTCLIGGTFRSFEGR